MEICGVDQVLAFSVVMAGEDLELRRLGERVSEGGGRREERFVCDCVSFVSGESSNTLNPNL